MYSWGLSAVQSGKGAARPARGRRWSHTREKRAGAGEGSGSGTVRGGCIARGDHIASRSYIFDVGLSHLRRQRIFDAGWAGGCTAFGDASSLMRGLVTFGDNASLMRGGWVGDHVSGGSALRGGASSALVQHMIW